LLYRSSCWLWLRLAASDKEPWLDSLRVPHQPSFTTGWSALKLREQKGDIVGFKILGSIIMLRVAISVIWSSSSSSVIMTLQKALAMA